jgi:hypothetical protein
VYPHEPTSAFLFDHLVGALREMHGTSMLSTFAAMRLIARSNSTGPWTATEVLKV